MWWSSAPGASGLPAALAAAEAGASVCVLQKEPKAASQGASCCYINRESTDDLAIAHLLRHMSDNGDSRGSWDLNRAWAENCTDALNWFMGHLTEAGYQENEDYKHFPIAKFDYPEGSANLNVYIFPKNVGGAIERLAESTSNMYALKTETPAVQLDQRGQSHRWRLCQGLTGTNHPRQRQQSRDSRFWRLPE